MARRRLALILATPLPFALLLAGLTAGVAAGGAGCHAGIERDAEETTVRLVQSCMDPLVARVPTGADVTFVNADSIPHAVTGAANRWGTYDDLGPNAGVSYRFSQPGVYPYFCYIHPGMVGAIVVGGGDGAGGGESVERVTNAAARSTAAPTKPTTKAATTTEPTTEPTPAATPEPTATAAPAAVPAAPAGGSSPTGPNSLLTLGLLAVLLGAGAAYGFGLLPGAPRPRTRSR